MIENKVNPSHIGITKRSCVHADTVLSLAAQIPWPFLFDLPCGLAIILKRQGTHSGYQLIKYRLLLKENSNWDWADSCMVSLVYEEYFWLENIERRLAFHFFLRSFKSLLFRKKNLWSKFSSVTPQICLIPKPLYLKIFLHTSDSVKYISYCPIN